jgi:hypothetical protein
MRLVPRKSQITPAVDGSQMSNKTTKIMCTHPLRYSPPSLYSEHMPNLLQCSTIVSE